MTEDNSVQQTTAPEATPVTTANDQNEFTQASNTGNYVSQDKVNSIAGSARKNGYDSGYEKGLQEALARQSIPQQQSFQQPVQQAIPAQQGANYGESDARQEAARFVREEWDAHQRKLQEQEAQRLEQETLSKFKQADEMLEKQKSNPEVLEKYPEFAEDYDRNGGFNDPVMSRVKYAASYFDNSLDIIANLFKDKRMADTIALAATDQRLIQHMQEYSDGLKSNAQAQNSKSPQQPLSDVNASTGLKMNGNGTGAASASWSSFDKDPRLMS